MGVGATEARHRIFAFEFERVMASDSESDDGAHSDADIPAPRAADADADFSLEDTGLSPEIMSLGSSILNMIGTGSPHDSGGSSSDEEHFDMTDMKDMVRKELSRADFAMSMGSGSRKELEDRADIAMKEFAMAKQEAAMREAMAMSTGSHGITEHSAVSPGMPAIATPLSSHMHRPASGDAVLQVRL